ncbi:hypothetical protein M0802_002314 [Mischocyttarus mexicanus]|nr:hypothetical protein M0802_002314 [Mischocyttarus mexicanus]
MFNEQQPHVIWNTSNAARPFTRVRELLIAAEFLVYEARLLVKVRTQSERKSKGERYQYRQQKPMANYGDFEL